MIALKMGFEFSVKISILGYPELDVRFLENVCMYLCMSLCPPALGSNTLNLI